MRVLVLADLHDDFWADAGRDPFAGTQALLEGVEALVLAGDVSNKPKVRWRHAFGRLRARFGDVPIHVFPGNHDFYDFRIDGEERLAAIAADFGVSWAQERVIAAGGARLVCATLWTDLELGGGRSANEAQVPARLNDYRFVRKASAGYRRIVPADIVSLHRAHRDFVARALAEPFDGPTVVVTHHAPHPWVLGARERDLPAAYASDLSALLAGPDAPDLWLFGHAHGAAGGRVGRTELRCVALGYPDHVADADIAPRLSRGLLDL